MRKTLVSLALVAALVSAETAFGELQNVRVGGSVRIRGNYYTSPAIAESPYVRNPLFQGPLTPSFYPGTNPLANLRYQAQPGRLAVTDTLFSWNKKGGPDLSMVEQRTKLNLRTDFTDNVSAFIELDAYNLWGEDFRSNYITGIDYRGVPEMSLYQSYIDAKEMFGLPLQLRIGRQELKFGSGWLVAPNDTAAFFYGTSFDGVRATYKTDQYSVDAFWTKLVETSPLEQDGDVDFGGVYASYTGIDKLTFDAYWFWVRDGRSLANTYNGPVGSWIEHAVGVDDYDVTNLHTFGLRGAGTVGGLDFDAEVAYQTGNADQNNYLFSGAAGPLGEDSPYGPTGVPWANWGANLIVGYTFADVPWTPRVFINGAYFGGQDNREVDVWSWANALVNPFWHARSSVSFNRLFSNYEYSEFIENTDLSNAWVAKVGVAAKPIDNLLLTLSLAHFETLAAYDSAWPVFFIFGERVEPFYEFSFLDRQNSKDLGYEAEIIATYNYTADLSFEVGYAHLFTGDGLKEGNFSNGNGLMFNGGTAGDDGDYVYFETKLTF